jgi:hypothetical protein
MMMYVRITGFDTVAYGLSSREPASCGLSTYWDSSPASDRRAYGVYADSLTL